VQQPQWQTAKKATGGDCGDGRNSSSRKKVEAAAAKRDSNDRGQKVFLKGKP